METGGLTGEEQDAAEKKKYLLIFIAHETTVCFKIVMKGLPLFPTQRNDIFEVMTDNYFYSIVTH